MEWVQGDIIDVCRDKKANGVVFTANSVILKNGDLCLGAGAAKRVRDYFPASVPSALAQEIKQNNDRIQPDYYLAGIQFKLKETLEPFYIFALQVKRDFNDKGDLSLTVESLQLLAEWCNANPGVKLVLNCPLIGLGGFSDQKEDIKNIVDGILFNCDVVVTLL